MVRSIEESDTSVLLREESGHWEVVLVLSKKTKGEPVILTMVERKSLTIDNGVEFSTLFLVEEKTPHIKVSFTHAFAALEKGENERHNGLLRVSIPKRKSLKLLKYNDFKRYTDAINYRPRKTARLTNT